MKKEEINRIRQIKDELGTLLESVENRITYILTQAAEVANIPLQNGWRWWCDDAPDGSTGLLEQRFGDIISIQEFQDYPSDRIGKLLDCDLTRIPIAWLTDDFETALLEGVQRAEAEKERLRKQAEDKRIKKEKEKELQRYVDEYTEQKKKELGL